MATRIKDRFDDIPDDLTRVGAHRAPAPRSRRWIGLAWAAAATVVLVAGGLFGLSLLNPDLGLTIPGVGTSVEAGAPGTGDDAAAVVEPALDPEVAITVLNGTGTAGLATSVGDSLEEKGWGGAALGIGSRANAAADDVATTQIYYSDPEHEAAVLQLVHDLGVGQPRLSNDYPASPITILIGADYVTPAA
ncbi:LytR C-terminal domain-containing protein [Salinibacterium hongtaonis]|uniref:LytR/CpsA/Psr regulator C-terminal domain-containing protein n=1 Tax=Homoserinimonas hongtaonis TaxID=2079791 RepID=A0A2U1T2T4_9MICO|nr:LytR C-terminal domain-containing protein [Salinibacterium hongtaonis]PWB98194.1 hypothetical protein DF220_10415 [Salinibacterium hongtaonis]